MAGFYISMMFVGILLMVISLVWITFDKKKHLDYKVVLEEKKDMLVSVISDAEQMVGELNNISDYLVSHIDKKREEFVDTIKKTDKKVKEIADKKIKSIADQKIKAIADQKAKTITDERIKAITNKKIKATADIKIKEVVDERIKAIADEKIKTIADEKVKDIIGEKVKTIIDAIVETITDEEVKDIVDEKIKTIMDARIESISDEKVKDIVDEKIKTIIDARIESISDEEVKDIAGEKSKTIFSDSEQPLMDSKNIVFRNILSEDSLNNSFAKNKIERRNKIISINSKYKEVIDLSQSGLDETQIAKKLKMGKGEIELVLGISK